MHHVYEKHHFVFVPTDEDICKMLKDSVVGGREGFKDVESKFVRPSFNRLRCAMINLDSDLSPTG